MARTFRPIVPEMLERAAQAGPAAIARYDDFGRADRRVAAIALLMAGGAPFAGWLLLDWEPAAVVVAVLANLLLRIVDDGVRILSAQGRSAAVLRDRDDDEFVWPVAAALARGRREIRADATSASSYVVSAGGAFLACGLAMPLMFGPGASLGSGTPIVLGSLPNLVLMGAFAWLGRHGEHGAWRRAASVRLQGASAMGNFAFWLGLLVLFVAVLPQNPPMSDRTLALACTLATIGYGAWRLRAVHELDYTRRVFARRLQDQARYGSAL